MDVVLARIDDRLIHGQVTVGWSRHLEPDLILLCDRAAAADPWQARVYASSVPPNLDVAVLGPAAAVSRLRDPTPTRTILLTAGPADMLALVRDGAPLREVNLGGMHWRKGTVELNESVWLDRGDIVSLRALLGTGCRVAARPVPGARETVLDGVTLADLESRL